LRHFTAEFFDIFRLQRVLPCDATRHEEKETYAKTKRQIETAKTGKAKRFPREEKTALE
jgi:hypothetical protein